MFIDEIQKLRLKRADIREQITKLDADLTSAGVMRIKEVQVQTTKDNIFEKKIADLIDLRDELIAINAECIEKEKKLLSRLDGLRPLDAKIILMRISGISYEDIADELGIEIGTAYNYYHRGKEECEKTEK